MEYGKSIFTAIFASFIERNFGIKILIIDASFNKTIYELFGLKLKYDEIIKYKKTGIDIVSLNNINSLEKFLKYRKNYNLILIDTSSNYENSEIIKLSQSTISIIEPNLIGISKYKKISENLEKDKEKNFIFMNKVSKNSIDRNIFKIIFSDFSYLGIQNKLVNLEKYINKQKIYEMYLDRKNYKRYFYICKKVFKIRKNKKHYINVLYIYGLLRKMFTKEEKIYGIRTNIR